MLLGSRRRFLLSACGVAAGLYGETAQATLLRGLTLPALVQRSQRIVVLEPLTTTCLYVQLGGRRSLVTDTLVALHHTWRGAGSLTELTLRTLGGRLDGVGELVHGQPLLRLGERSVAFLKLGRDGQVWWTTGMAQGHYPLTDAGRRALLQADPHLPTLLRPETSAVAQLVGRRLDEARELVRRAVSL